MVIIFQFTHLLALEQCSNCRTPVDLNRRNGFGDCGFFRRHLRPESVDPGGGRANPGRAQDDPEKVVQEGCHDQIEGKQTTKQYVGRAVLTFKTGNFHLTNATMIKSELTSTCLKL